MEEENSSSPQKGKKVILSHIEDALQKAGVASPENKEELASFLQASLRILGKVDWLGVVYFERLRARPVQVTIGETVQVIWMAPGDTVQITQKFETKKSVELESITDREREKQLEIGSTWSTEWNRSVGSTNSTTLGISETAGVGPFPELPLTISTGLNMSQSFTDTVEERLRIAQEATQKQSSRAREQHKVTVKQSSEFREESGISRTSRNSNPARVLSLEIKKLYRKDHISFERYDSRLCLALTAIDPGREMRRAFLEGLEKMDPANDKLYRCTHPGQPEDREKEITILNPNLSRPTGTLIFLDSIWDDYEISPKTSGFLLLKQPTLEVTDWDWIEYKIGSQVTHDGNASGFKSHGGWVKVRNATKGISTQSVEIHALFPRGLTWRTKHIKVKVRSRWGPKDADLAAYKSCLEGEYERLRADFSVDKVRALFERCRLQIRESVLRRVVEDHFLNLLPDQLTAEKMTNFEEVRQYFDWSAAIIDTLSWWLLPTSAQYHQEVRDALSALPFEQPIDEFLDQVMIAPAARVYLPIRSGFEQQAIELYAGKQKVLTRLVSSFVKDRETRFGTYKRDLPTAEALCAPGYPSYTSLKANRWQYDWEQPQSKFEVLGTWSELLPLDGVHAEPFLSERTAIDESQITAQGPDRVAGS